MFRKNFDSIYEAIHEIEINRRLSHPCIIGLISYEVKYDSYSMSMVKADSTLKCFIENNINYNNKFEIIDRLGHALDYIHNNRIVHLDIKLDNVLMIGNLAYLSDFGNSKYIDDKIEPFICNSEYYRPPEALNLFDIEEPLCVDMWAFGILILHIDMWKVRLFSNSPGLYDEDINIVKLIENNYSKVSDNIIELVNDFLIYDPTDRRNFYKNLDIIPIHYHHPKDEVLDIKNELNLKDIIFDDNISNIPELWISCIKHSSWISDDYCQKKMQRGNKLLFEVCNIYKYLNGRTGSPDTHKS